ncbi:MAG: hypothetical protein V7L04_28610 [Nostoc sp.]|uniref:hypothetical protein n=1 Tax=Nostoc sp. TaxID=1180 RepID=UPI002FFA9239
MANIIGTNSNHTLALVSSNEADNNTLNGGAGNDTLSASGSKGDNLLSGGDGNDSLDISGYQYAGSG